MNRDTAFKKEHYSFGNSGIGPEFSGTSTNPGETVSTQVTPADETYDDEHIKELLLQMLLDEARDQGIEV